MLKNFIPPDRWKVPVIIIAGIFTGLALFAFHISKAPSYLSDKPETCVNCHIMAPQYSTWKHSAHREVAHCNDCHVPHNTVINKYYFKAKDGMRHASIFTLRKEPQVILIREEGANVVQENCIRCHAAMLQNIEDMRNRNITGEISFEKKCVSCHRETPHGRVSSLSSVPFARIPLPGSPVPELFRLKKNRMNINKSIR